MIRKLLVAAVAILGVAVWAVPQWAVRAALDRHNEAGRSVSVEDIRQASIDESATALSAVGQGDLLFRASIEGLVSLVNESLAVAAAGKLVPVSISALAIVPDRQLLGLSAEVSGTLDNGIQIKGRVSGAIAPAFSGGELVMRAAFRSIEIQEAKIPGWHWLPGSVARILNPAVADAITRINGALPEQRWTILPPATEPQTIQIAGRDLAIPALAPTTPALMIDRGGIYVLAQLLAQTSEAAPRALPQSPTFEALRTAFAAKAEARHPGFVQLPYGVHLSNVFLDRLLGSLRALDSTEEIARDSVRTAARGLNLIRGPDVAVRVPAEQATQLIGDALGEALKKVDGPFSVQQVRSSLLAGAIILDVDARAEIRLSPANVADTSWAVQVVIIPRGTVGDGRAGRLVPRLGKIRMTSISLTTTGASAIAGIGPALNAFVESLVTTVNTVLPAIPLDLPIASPAAVTIEPIAVAGGTVGINPARFSPPAYQVDRAVVAVSERGMWVLADASVHGAPTPPAAAAPMAQPDQATADEIDAAIAEMVRRRYGDTPQASVFAVASWQRFAELFNAGWASLAPSANARLDTGTMQIPSRGINLVEHARFSCGRTEQCDRPRCEQASCTRPGCDNSCPSINVPAGVDCCPPRVRTRTVEEPTCVGRRTLCNAAADTTYGACQTRAAADRARCDMAAEATVLACNARVEAQVGLCNARLLLANGLAEISGVGSISGNARVRVNATIDARQLVLTTTSPGAEFHPAMSGSVVGNLSIDWTPYDALGHLSCPRPQNISAEVTASFPGSPFRVGVSVAQHSPATAAGGVPAPAVLSIRVERFRVPVRLEPGLLTALLAQNPQLLITCGPAASLLVPGLVMGGTFRAISENQLAAALAPVSIPTALMLYASQNEDIRAAMGVLFGGRFSVPVDPVTLDVPVADQILDFLGRKLTLRPSLERGAFRFSLVP